MTTFTRDITMGGNAFTEEIQKQLNISYDEAEALKVGGQGDSDAVVPQEVERVIQGVAEQLGGEIQRSLDFYASTAARREDHPRLSSPAAPPASPRSSRSSRAAPACPVEILNPFKNIEIDNKKFDPAVLLAAAPRRRRRRRPRAPPSRGQVAMIRINLLPVRVSKKKAAGKQQLLLLRPARRARLRRQLRLGADAGRLTSSPAQQKVPRRSDEIAQLDRIIGEVKNIKAQQAALREKLDILAELKAGRSGPVRVLDALATRHPEAALDHEVRGEGRRRHLRPAPAATIDDVSAFMTALKAEPALRAASSCRRPPP